MKSRVIILLLFINYYSSAQLNKSIFYNWWGVGVNVLDPLTITHRYWSADQSFQDDAMTIPSGNNQPVLTIKEQKNSVLNLDWIGTTVGAGVEKQNDNDYGDTQPYPVYHSENGGFIHIRNATPKKYETQGGSLGYTGDVSFYFMIRLMAGLDNEYIFFVTNGPMLRDRDEATGNSTQIGATPTVVTLSTGGRFWTQYAYQLIFVEIHRLADGTAQLYINGDAWGEAVNIGTNTINEFAFGSNAHNANVMNYKGAIRTGIRDAGVSTQLMNFWETKHGAVGSLFPGVTALFNPGGVLDSKETWNTSDKSINAPVYVFRSPTGAPEGATEYRLYTSQSSTQATALTQRTYVKTKIRGVDANPTKFIRGTDFGVDAGSPTNVWYWIEIIGVDSNGVRQIIETQTHGILDFQS